MYPTLPPLSPEISRFTEPPAARCSCDYIDVNSGNFLVDSSWLCDVHAPVNLNRAPLPKPDPVPKKRKRRVQWKQESCEFLCRLIRESAESLSTKGRGNYQVLESAWEEAEDAPEGVAPSKRGLQRHMQLRTHRGKDHSCAQAYDPYRLSSAPEKKRARLILRIPSKYIKALRAPEGELAESD